jgi:hypothetical protein
VRGRAEGVAVRPHFLRLDIAPGHARGGVRQALCEVNA